jgi:hypothetical protein
VVLLRKFQMRVTHFPTAFPKEKKPLNSEINSLFEVTNPHHVYFAQASDFRYPNEIAFPHDDSDDES